MTLDANVRGSPGSRKSATGDHVTALDGEAMEDEEEEGSGRSPSNQQEGGGGGGGGSSRRVSFQLDKVCRQHSQGSRNNRRSEHRASPALPYPLYPSLPPPGAAALITGCYSDAPCTPGAQ